MPEYRKMNMNSIKKMGANISLVLTTAVPIKWYSLKMFIVMKQYKNSVVELQTEKRIKVMSDSPFYAITDGNGKLRANIVDGVLEGIECLGLYQNKDGELLWLNEMEVKPALIDVTYWDHTIYYK